MLLRELAVRHAAALERSARRPCFVRPLMPSRLYPIQLNLKLNPVSLSAIPFYCCCIVCLYNYLWHPSVHFTFHFHG